MTKKTVLFSIMSIAFLFHAVKIKAEKNDTYYHYFKEPIGEHSFETVDSITAGKHYKIMKITDKIFNKYNIKYWADGGTLLGAIRHKGFIPWDNDNDIAMFEEDRDTILSLNSIFNTYGYRVSPWEWGGLRIYPLDGTYPLVDIFLCKQENDRIVLSRAKYPHYYWLPEEIKTLERAPFGPFKINVCSNPLRFLHTYYGKDVMTHARHYVEPWKKAYTIINFSPAVYIMPT